MRILRAIVIVAGGLALLAAPAVGEWALDESPAAANNWGYRPSPDYPPAEVNPPGFTWRPTPGAVSYTLEVARDPAFTQIVYRVAETPWSAHGPTEPFAPATRHYWRYAATNEDGARTAWSRVRTFEVPPEAVLFPRMPLEDMIARIDRAHPRLWFTGDDLPRLRALAEGPLASHFEALLARADRLVESPPDTTEPPLYPDEVVRRSAEWREIWWGNRRRVIAVTDGAALLGFAYHMTGDTRYADAGKALLLAFASWDPKGATEYEYNDEAGMAALKYPARAYSWLRDHLTLEEQTRVAAVMRERGRQCFAHLQRHGHLWNPYGSHRNRSWHFLGEIAVAFMHEIPEAPEWLDYATTVFYTCYPVWGDADGGWHEGLAYWSSYLTRFNFWTLLMRSAFDIDIFDRPFFRQTGYFAMYVSPPGTQHSGFGDLAERPHVNTNAARTARIMAAGARNPHWLWYAEEIGADLPTDYFGFLLAAGAPQLAPESPDTLPTAMAFHGTGIAALNTSLHSAATNVQVLFKSSPMGSVSHGHNANNHFMLNIGGQPALIHTGSRDIHGSPHHREWMWRTVSQNAILVNGEGQRPHSAAARGHIVAFDTTPELDLVAGEAGESYPNLDRWIRTLVFLKPNCVVIHDRLEAPEPSTFEWLLHAPSRFILDEAKARWMGEGRSVDIAFAYPPDLTLEQTDGYDPPPHDWSSVDIDEWHLTARPKATSQTQDFVTVLRVHHAPTGAPPAAYTHTVDGSRHTITVDGRDEVLVFTPDALTIQHGDDTRTFSLR